MSEQTKVRPLADVTVVIPTLNAARTLGGTLDGLTSAVHEVIVVDGGSGDATCDIARDGGARLMFGQRGRGAQIGLGVAAAATPWLLILHADTFFAPGWIEAAQAHTGDPGRAGYFRFALDSADPRARRLERLVAWRCRVLALPYGDQGLLISRRLLAEVGGVRPLPLMEDVDFVRRLGRRRLAALPVAAITSAERWRRHGWQRRSARNLACLALYLCGVPLKFIARLYA